MYMQLYFTPASLLSFNIHFCTIECFMIYWVQILVDQYLTYAMIGNT